MPTAAKHSIFKTDRRIKLGIWGLGRGMSFFKTCEALHFDVVAGCDYNEHMRESFRKRVPGAFVTDDEDAFLAQDMDAVLVATFCPAHAADSIKALDAGKHVLSEVTSFHTMAEGVALCDAVERSGKIYNLAENYPFSKANMYLFDKWRKEFFGELMYAEYEYVHEIRSLQYTYIDGVPVQPGWSVHNWRSWMDFHYYNTHSLGPVMHITGERPTRVVALPGTRKLPGYITDSSDGMGGISPSLITFGNGGVMRNLMGSTTNDTHTQRLWGTLAAAEINNGLFLRLGGGGSTPKMKVTPEWPFLGDLASKTGHGGGDFWVLYYFAREILTGEPGPFNIYAACNCTAAGILAYRSSMENGRPFDVPDFADKQAREAHRDDHFHQSRFDTREGVFPPNADKGITGGFSTTMKNVIRGAEKIRAFLDWQVVFEDVHEKERVIGLGEDVVKEIDEIQKAYRHAHRIIDAYPDSVGSRCLSEMLELGRHEQALAPNFKREIKNRVCEMRKRQEVAVAAD